MVRTKADRVPTKAVGSKAPSSKAANNAPSKKVGGGSKGKNYSGGNPYHPRETPEWQKPITCFLHRGTATEENPSAQAQPLSEVSPDKGANVDGDVANHKLA